MLATVCSSATLGVDAYLVEVEVDVSRGGMYRFMLVGLPDAAVKESAERVAVALRSQGYRLPITRVLVNLAPADIRKEGPAFDLPIALGILVASGQVSDVPLGDFLIAGELSLEGTVRPITGALSIALAARAQGRRGILLPAENAAEASVVRGLEVYPVTTVREAVAVLKGAAKALEAEGIAATLQDPGWEIDFSDVRGQENVKRALEVAAAGGHNLLMAGPPGSGKTMLARRLATILPPLTFEEALEVTKLYSVTGLLGRDRASVSQRPFRAPHHTVSDAGLIGGGSIPRPGEISLAHNGVLFLDELPEFNRSVLEVMRQPLEEDFVTIARVAASLSFPARCIFVGAMNPCPCGYFGDTLRPCTCSEQQIRRYLGRISGPLLDRIDIHIEVPRLKQEELLAPGGVSESSREVRARVQQARAVQLRRFEGSATFVNAAMSSRQTRQFCAIQPAAAELLKSAIARLGLSARAYDRILRLSRTIADLDGAESIDVPHVAEGVQYRTLDRQL